MSLTVVTIPAGTPAGTFRLLTPAAGGQPVPTYAAADGSGASTAPQNVSATRYAPGGSYYLELTASSDGSVTRRILNVDSAANAGGGGGGSVSGTLCYGQIT